MFLLYFYFGYIAEVGTGGLGNLTGDMSFLQTDRQVSARRSQANNHMSIIFGKYDATVQVEHAETDFRDNTVPEELLDSSGTVLSELSTLT